jgi:predicted transglutaminase-like cysteine proteinase
MRRFRGLIAAASLFALATGYDAKADVIRSPLGYRIVAQFIKFDQPALAPMTFTLFCLKNGNECKPRRIVFRGGRTKLTAERLTELKTVNRQVNLSILPERNTEGLAGEKWLIRPASGDCNDYAVTKRHDLIAKGWPARNVLLSEVVTTWGEHHLVVVVRTSAGDLVLDNLSGGVLPWTRTPYRWVRIQKPSDPNYWASLDDRNA